MSMFCFQCQEAAGGTGCSVRGVCGKTEGTSGLQDLLVHTVKSVGALAGLSSVSHKKAEDWAVHALFMTITNANFDNDAIRRHIRSGLAIRDELSAAIPAARKASLPTSIFWKDEEKDWEAAGFAYGVLSTEHPDVRSLRELIIYGVKGLAAYVHHADMLGYRDESVNSFILKAMGATLNDALSADELTALVLETGSVAVTGMALLDTANTETYGHPGISTVQLGVRKNPGILISGHDLKDLEELLAQTENTGVDVYTHSEMLPAHYYPAFKKYTHFAGNYGNAWWMQTEEFEKFQGPVLLTTNCLVPPKDSYRSRVFTTGAAGFPGCTHIADRNEGGVKDFSAVIEMAKRCQSPVEIENGTLVGGFAHKQVADLAGKVLEAVQAGAIRKFVVMAGCDGRQKGRGYYTEFAEKLPGDTVILTAGCAKYRYNKLDLGDIGGIPRILDAGQCNDSYSLALTALTLKDALGLDDINKLPIVYNIAWYEQKAVIVLLALLALGVKNIHLGPTLPAFLSPGVADVLVKNFGIAPIGTVDEDMSLLIG